MKDTKITITKDANSITYKAEKFSKYPLTGEQIGILKKAYNEVASRLTFRGRIK